MLLKYIHKFNNLYKKHLGEKILLFYPLTVLDYIFSFCIHGSSITDYFSYNFYKLNHKGRKDYITLRRHRYIQKKCNDKNKIKFCRDKVLFNQKFSNLLGRRWLNVDEASLEEFSRFVNEMNGEIFIKGKEGFCGNDVTFKKLDDKEIKPLFSELKSKGNYIIEERIVQKGEINEFNNSSVNTIRMTTLYNPFTKEVKIMKANIRFGIKGSPIDNLHAGSVAAHIDIPTGIIFQPGFDKENNPYIYHPTSNRQIVGFQIPYWDECKNYIISAAMRIPEIGYIGWDIVSKGDGSFCLIEANDNGDHDIQQINYKGLWPLYKKTLKSFQMSK